MSRKYKFHDQDKLYFISFATVHWIDVFIREDYLKIILDSWKFCQEKKGLEIYGWCIMPSHIHLNPVMAGFVINPEDWKYSSARDFSGVKGLVELNFS